EFDHLGRRRHVRSEATIELTDESFALTSPWLPGATVSGELRRESPVRWTAYIDGVEIVANWSNGWTYAVLDASGTLAIEGGVVAGEEAPQRVTVELMDTIDLWTLTEGEIRYFDDYIRGEEGLGRVQARLDRTEAYAGWLRESHSGSGALRVGHARRDGAYGESLVEGMENALGRVSDAVPDWMAPLLESGTVERDLLESAQLIQFFVNIAYVESAVLDGEMVWERY
ncbi:MAG: hypothetical protein MI724_20380, partial [Spirochaetales bacterium]|nr:hypothetical protein [Spirochaetales bacterium]